MDFKKALSIQNILVPELSDLLRKRYSILRFVKNNQPIGRRILSLKIGMTERILRAEVEKLRELGLINIEISGMRLSPLGENIIIETEELIYNIKGLNNLEQQIKNKLGIDRILIVEGNSSENNIVKKDLGRKTSIIIQSLLEDNMIVGIMGGTTMAVVAEEMEINNHYKNILVVPGRGGLGEKLEIQANSIAAKLAQKIGANYMLLHVPDNIEPDLLEVLKKNPQIKRVLDEIKNINMIVFGIGTAVEMSNRRGLSDLKKDELKLKNASAEALGCYFDKNGTLIMHSDSVGIDLDDLIRVKHVICAAAGTNKAEAIYAFSKYYKNYTLVTDENTAKEILKLN